MKRTMICAGLAAAAAALAVSCSNPPENLLSPSAVTETDTVLNADGSSVKANAPTELSPNGGTLDSRQPTLAFTNATGLFVPGRRSQLRARDPGRRGRSRSTRGWLASRRRVASTRSKWSSPTPRRLWWRVRAGWTRSSRPVVRVRPDPDARAAATAATTAAASAATNTDTPADPDRCRRPGCSSRRPAPVLRGGSPAWPRSPRCPTNGAVARAGSGVGCHRFTRQVVCRDVVVRPELADDSGRSRWACLQLLRLRPERRHDVPRGHHRLRRHGMSTT